MNSRITHQTWLAYLAVFLLSALWALGGAPAYGQNTTSTTQPEEEPALIELFSEDATCYDATAFSQQFIPFYMANDEPDSLLMTIDFWENNCGSAEPIRRARILASIWDGAFSEDLYDTRLIDDLIWRYDPERKKAQTEGGYPDLDMSDVSSLVDFYAQASSFDDFTAAVADQLLPYIEQGGVEEFFCLFYSGRSTAAFALLDGDALEDTELHRRYHQELSHLTVPTARNFWGVTGGFWRPMADLALVGNHASGGFFAGRRWSDWFVRTEISLRLGRSDEPYFVSSGDFKGFSNRYGGLSLGLETGPTLWRSGRVRFDLLVGGSIEALNPFEEEEDLVLTTFHRYAGAGFQVALGRKESWFLGLDWRREWISDPEEEGTELGGDAWNVRLSLGFFIKSATERRLAGLGR